MKMAQDFSQNAYVQRLTAAPGARRAFAAAKRASMDPESTDALFVEQYQYFSDLVALQVAHCLLRVMLMCTHLHDVTVCLLSPLCGPPPAQASGGDLF